jgi:TonB family protein
VAHRVSQKLSLDRRGVPIAVAILLLLGSGVANFAVVGGALTMLETEPFEDDDETLLVIDLTEPEPAPEKPEPEVQEPEPEPELEPEKKPDWKLVEPEPEPEVEEPEPEPEPEPAPEEPEEPPPQEIEPVPANMKMVEQLDEFDDEQTNENPDFLSNIDRKVEEQTRAEITNLSQDALVAEASQVEPSDSPERGTAAQDEIRQTETQRSAVARQAPDVKPEDRDLRPQQDDPKPESMLATRELAEREHAEAMEAKQDLAIEADDGSVEIAQLESASMLAQDQQAKIMRRDPRYQFKLSRNELDALYGKDRNAPKNVESLELSKNEGVWDDARKAYQSPLENMVPEVQVGNQTALNSRKHPFARYVATIHRGIHEAWAFGYLEALDARPASHPLNKQELWTRVEIVLNGDGTIDKLRTIHHSGNSSFDAAAREVVFASGPYPNPPKEIRSGNGKIYIHWAFHRNEYACGTNGVNVYILDNAGAGDIPDAHAPVPHAHGSGGSHEEHTRALVRNDGSGNLSGGASEAQTEQLRRGGEGSGGSMIPEGPARPPPQSTDPAGAGSGAMPQGPRGPVVAPGGRGPGGFGSGGAGTPGQGRPGGTSGAGSGAGSGSGAGAPKPASKPGPKSVPLSGQRSSNNTSSATQTPDAEETRTPPEVETQIDPIAINVAKNWARAFAKGEITTMVNRSAVPFHAGSKVAAKSKEELQGLLEAMSDEVQGKGAAKVGSTYSAAGLRKKFGSVPDGVEEGEGRLYTVVEIGGDTVILMLEKRFGSWRIIGITR